MSTNIQASNEQSPDQQKQSDKELNFRKQEEMFTRKLEQERQARIAAEERAAQIEKMAQQKLSQTQDDDEDSDEPYIDKKTLKKQLSKFGQQTQQETENKIQNAVQKALSDERKQNWMKNNPDFYDVMQHAQKFAEKDPELAETILEMPDTFERQKLVYKNIKALGIHKKEDPKSNIQETIDNNRKNPYYQPSGMGAPPYGMIAGGKDYSPSEGKNAYSKMKELQARLRI